jgi:hypothetical protein
MTEKSDTAGSEERNEELRNPEPGHPAEERLSDESSPGQLDDTPAITDTEQDETRTGHPAPDDDVGVPEDVGD